MQQHIAGIKAKIMQVSRDRDRLRVEKEALVKDFERKERESGQHKADLGDLQATVQRLKGEQTRLREQAESLREKREKKRLFVTLREHEISMLSKEISKIEKQKSALQSSKVKLTRTQPKSKSQNSLKKATSGAGLPRSAIRPFTSLGFGFGLFDS